MHGGALRVSVVVRTASTLSSERKGLRRAASRRSGPWAPDWIAGDADRRRWPRSLPIPKPTVDRPLSLPTFKVDSMSNVVGAILAVGTRLGLRGTAKAVA
jgi:hypothetical protein